MLKKFFLFAILVMNVWAEGDKKVVVDLTTGNIQSFEKKILSGLVFTKEYYESKLETLHVAIIIHGDAYKFFVKDLDKSVFNADSELKAAQTNLKKRIKSLATMYEIEFLMCQYGATKRFKITKDDVYEFVTMIPSASIGLIEKQNEGYAYLPAH